MKAPADIQSGEQVFVDAWGWLALGHPRDSHHRTATRLFKELRQGQARLVTSDYVLGELISLLFRRLHADASIAFVGKLIKSVSAKALDLQRIHPGRFAQAWAMRVKFKDRPEISFTDLTSLVLIDELKIKHVLTQDQHFAQVGFDLRLIP